MIDAVACLWNNDRGVREGAREGGTDPRGAWVLQNAVDTTPDVMQQCPFGCASEPTNGNEFLFHSEQLTRDVRVLAAVCTKRSLFHSDGRLREELSRKLPDCSECALIHRLDSLGGTGRLQANNAVPTDTEALRIETPRTGDGKRTERGRNAVGASCITCFSSPSSGK